MYDSETGLYYLQSRYYSPEWGRFINADALVGETGEKGLKKVKNIFVNETDTLVHVYIDEEEIKTTLDHPFYVADKGWVGAGDLKQGDKVLLYSGKIIEIKKITLEKLDKRIKVYNFEVEDHIFMVQMI